MPTAMSIKKRRRSATCPTARGFSLLEMVVAATILMIGLLGVASAIGYAMVASNHGKSITNTKLLAVSILEQMETLRNTGQFSFGQVANVGQVDNYGKLTIFPGFPPGPQQVSLNPGPDGIYGTADDLVDAGNDGVYGTADDFVNPAFAVVGMRRQIQISSLGNTLKRVQVTVEYPASGGIKQLIAVGYINDNAHSNYIP